MKVRTEFTTAGIVLWTALGGAFLLPYLTFGRILVHTWFEDPEFSYGLLIPLVVAYLIWIRRVQLRTAVREPWAGSLAILFAGCGLQVLGSINGTLLFSGVALVLSLMGTVGLLWGRRCLRIVAVPLALLTLMIPLPSYLLGELSWNLQAAASTVSGKVLGSVGVPVYQDGNILQLPNYVLEVKEACSGSRSLFALFALALMIGFTAEHRWRVRIPLLAAAPAIAVGTNVIRIVGTGLMAWWFGEIAANESLHATWGVLIFLAAVMTLLGFQRLLRWVMSAYA
jgi:exosortase